MTRGQVLGFHNRVTCLVVRDVTPGVSVRHLMALCDVFVEKGLPFSCVVSLLSEAGRAPTLDDRLSSLLSAYAMQSKGFEIIPFVPGLSKRSSYFQGRAVRDAYAGLNSVLAPVVHLQRRKSWASLVACGDLPQPKSPMGVRSAGVRTVLSLPDEERPVSSETWPNGVVRLFGGKAIDLRSQAVAKTHTRPDATQALLYFSAADLETMTVEEISARATEFAEELLASERTGRNSVQLISDLQLRDHYGFRRYLAVHLTRPAQDDALDGAVFEDFVSDLRQEGLLVSIGEKPGTFDAGRVTDYWLPVSTQGFDPKAPLELDQVTRACGRKPVRSLRAGPNLLSPGHSLAFGDALQLTPGFDACGVFWLPSIDIASPEEAATFAPVLGKTNDVVISIRPQALKHGFARRALRNQLIALASDGVTQIVSVQFLGQLIAPQGAEIERQRRTIASLARRRMRRVSTADAERQALLEDARIAWNYFEDNTLRETGLCPATMNFSPVNGRVHQTVTMWDVGSHINGLIAARQLGLVSSAGFEQSIGKILRQVRGRRSQGRLLPQGWLRVDRHKWGNKNFDGSDAGRLLAAFVNLSRSFGMKDQINALVESWDLEKIVVRGEVHSVTDGELRSAYRSHSAHYAARAFRSWGIEVASPYEVFEGRSAYDDQMALLERVSWIGPIGAEPLLLEALELGMSKESAYLAEVLFAAQLEDHEETGRLIAVSEGPIDRAPWFTYQGLQMDAVRRTWALDTVGYEPQYANRAFWHENLVISSKAAYLWAAYKPHAYSEKLLRYVRAKARTTRGFASSIFSQSGRVTSTYTDLNTNAVILQAIANTLTAA
ncbi:DUF3131 domain-containing protein [Marimonas sp. MJW-29]|uniref:DUF3131 domain-containing protein n=1 Tax=Sulfitobacter sediminis TaxID=3234186 RepID=A0ABV3RT02_9RHOB